jgi:hypothetical protein
VVQYLRYQHGLGFERWHQQNVVILRPIERGRSIVRITAMWISELINVFLDMLASHYARDIQMWRNITLEITYLLPTSSDWCSHRVELEVKQYLERYEQSLDVN